eukprot:TRINITY_DN3410_c0_g2_i1.p1 TRINITY_DN3410_c0_g2~~TRINITY_DN3410_c0_g2_i1.p1  ORF type:complete len:120 (+),score=11.29 TRINITY_DN3410_c0_g2_i1:116-475(+)
MSAACLIYHIGSFDRLYEVGKPLIFRLKLETAQSFTILQHILLISRNRPDVFRPFVQDLFPSFRETKVIFDLKWQVLVNLVNETNISKYISHFKVSYPERIPESFFLGQQNGIHHTIRQ